MIPKILHRVLPAGISQEVNAWGELARELHPDWELRQHRDPLEPAEWPISSPHWASCRSGAQLAGLIRLEALVRDGGVYIDSDVECYRPFDPLLTTRAFVAWEDTRCIPDAVMGCEPYHPAFTDALAEACSLVAGGAGAWDSGPGVLTSRMPGRDDVLVLPPGALYPYHYSVKERDRDRDHKTEQPWAFCAHHWHASWVGKERAR